MFQCTLVFKVYNDCVKHVDNEWLCKGHKAYILSLMRESRGLFVS